MWERRPAREVALRVLADLFAQEEEQLAPDRTKARAADTGRGVGLPGEGAPPRTFPLTPFQEEAVRRLRPILARRGGAILADAVGLGKTYVALALAEERLASGGDVVAVVPATLRRTWRDALTRIGRGSRASPRSGRWRVVSHAQMSRGARVAPLGGARLVVVDEAHRFRNPRTRRYAALARLLDPRRSDPTAAPPYGPPHRFRRTDGAEWPVEALFLTATPVNNGTEDLYHLVRLFLDDGALADAGVPSLRAAFEVASVASRVRFVVNELLVRRTRGMVEARFGSVSPPGLNVRFPARAEPSVARYPDPGVAERVRAIEALALAPYAAGAAPLVRLALLKRGSSSAAAFSVTARHLAATLAACADAADVGCVLRPSVHRISGDGDPLQLTLLPMVADEALPGADLARLAASARADARTLRRLALEPADGDAKLDVLVRLLERLQGEKLVVFTEYRDTAEALWRRLSPRFRVGRVDGEGAWLGQRPAGRRTVVERFAPAANGRPPPPERERVDVLVATDVLAEGLNLQDASHVVSYDLPWNPVRLLQRIGRVDRLGSPHDVVVPHLFVPAQGLDAVLGLTRRLRTKLDGIADTMGEEQADELLECLAAGGGVALEQAIRKVEGRDGVEVREALRTAWVRRARGPTSSPGDRGRPPPASAPGTPFGEVRLPGSAVGTVEAVVLLAVGGRLRLLEVTPEGIRPPGRATLAVVTRALESDAVDPGPRGTAPDAVQTLARRAVYGVRAEAVIAGAPAPLRRTDPGTRLARAVRRAMAAGGTLLSPEVVRQADGVLRALGAPLPPAMEAAVLELLDREATRVPDPIGLLAAAARIVGTPGPDRGARGRSRQMGSRDRSGGRATPEPRVLAVLITTVDDDRGHD